MESLLLSQYNNIGVCSRGDGFGSSQNSCGLINQLCQNWETRKEISIWLDYENTFDLVPHDWLIKSLHLAKLPEDLIRAFEPCTSLWSTVLHLKGEEEEIIVPDITHFVKGIFQDDSLSVLLFILLVNPLPFLVHKLKGHVCGKQKNYIITHIFFGDDLKLYTSITNTAKKFWWW